MSAKPPPLNLRPREMLRMQRFGVTTGRGELGAARLSLTGVAETHLFKWPLSQFAELGRAIFPARQRWPRQSR
jgi:hypothetical protein